MDDKIKEKSISRRKLLKYFTVGATMISSFSILTNSSKVFAEINNKSLVLYFSRTGNTEKFAQQIHSIVRGDIVQLKTTKPYPSDYDETTAQARKELDSGFKPSIEIKIDNFNAYNTIFLGYPNWWGTIPMAFVTLFEQYDFAGKTIAAFATHEGSYLGNSLSDIKKYCPNSNVCDGITLRGRSSSKNLQNDITKWLRDNKI